MVARATAWAMSYGVRRGSGEDLYVNSREELDALLIANGVAEADVVATWDAIWPVLIDPDTGVEYVSSAEADNQIYNQGGILKSDIITALEALLSSYSYLVLAQNPSAYWRLGEPSGVTANDETATHNGTYVGGPTLGVAGLQSDGDTAVDFSGTGQYVNCGNSLSPTTNFSIIALIKPDSVTSQRQIVSKGYDGTNTQWQLYIENGALRFNTFNNPTIYGVTSVATLAVNTEYHVAATFDGTAYRIYINGSLDNSNAGNVPLVTTRNLCIGAVQVNSSSYTQLFDGTIDEVAVFESVLSPSVIASLYSAI